HPPESPVQEADDRRPRPSGEVEVPCLAFGQTISDRLHRGPGSNVRLLGAACGRLGLTDAANGGTARQGWIDVFLGAGTAPNEGVKEPPHLPIPVVRQRLHCQSKYSGSNLLYLGRRSGSGYASCIDGAPMKRLLTLAFAGLALAGCSDDVSSPRPGDPDDVRAMLHQHGLSGNVEATLAARLGRPVNPDLADLGRLLFFDRALGLHSDPDGSNGNSCAGCHSPS